MAGVNISQVSYQYTYETFIQQLRGINAINGGLMDGLSSGIISKSMFENNYRFYVFDLSRVSKDDKNPKSINIIGTNNTSVAMDLYVFVEYKKSLNINVETGEVNSN